MYLPLNRHGVRPGVLALGLSALLAPGLALVAPAHAQNAPIVQKDRTLPLDDSVLDVVSRATKLQPFVATQPMRVIIALKFPHPEQAEAYADAVSDPKSPLYRQFLTPEEVGERFGPAQTDYDKVVSHLKSNGLNIIQTPTNRMTVWATGSAPQIEAAFGVKLNVYRESELDRFHRAGPAATALTFFSNDRPAQLPAEIAPMVQVIDGLQNYTHPKPVLKRGAKRASSPFAPGDVRTAYGTASLYSAGYTGSGRTLGVSNWDGLNLTNAGDFVTAFGLPTPLSGGKPTHVSIENVAGGSTSTSGSGEGDLDPQMELGQAPLATIIIYSDPQASSPLSVISQEVSDNSVDIVSESYGWNLSASIISSCHTQHTMMTTQGITYLCASGDSGSNIGNYYYPDADPNITVVGGTTLKVGSSGARTSEVGWASSGGGYRSKAGFALPSWQKGTGVPTTIKYRLFPDIASNANGSNGAYQFYYSGQDETGAVGTSFASPATAGMLAITEQYLIAQGKLTANSAGKYRLGNINPALYALNGNSSDFYDITSGKNGKYSATKGWDYVTGWGAINFANIAGSL